MPKNYLPGFDAAGVNAAATQFNRNSDVQREIAFKQQQAQAAQQAAQMAAQQKQLQEQQKLGYDQMNAVLDQIGTNPKALADFAQIVAETMGTESPYIQTILKAIEARQLFSGSQRTAEEEDAIRGASIKGAADFTQDATTTRLKANTPDYTKDLDSIFQSQLARDAQKTQKLGEIENQLGADKTVLNAQTFFDPAVMAEFNYKAQFGSEVNAAKAGAAVANVIKATGASEQDALKLIGAVAAHAKQNLAKSETDPTKVMRRRGTTQVITEEWAQRNEDAVNKELIKITGKTPAEIVKMYSDVDGIVEAAAAVVMSSAEHKAALTNLENLQGATPAQKKTLADLYTKYAMEGLAPAEIRAKMLKDVEGQ